METVSAFLEELRTSRVLDPEQVDELLRNTPVPGDNPEPLAETLVGRGWLTAFQARELLRGQGARLVVGPYRLQEPLGEGGMGQVFKALHPRLNRVVALKLIRPDLLGQNTEAVRRFQREAMAAAQLNHPNIVTIYDAGQIDNTHFIAMEYVEGTDLARLVKLHGPVAIARACDYVRQAALGLQHAHEHGLVHRDVKPSNLLLACGRPAPVMPARGLSGISFASGFLADSTLAVTPHRRARLEQAAAKAAGASGSSLQLTGGGTVKIMDMGLVRVIAATEETGASGALTQQGMPMGTPDFIAPEQARDARKADIRSDLYSLGCTFYFLLTGRPPFLAGTMMEKLIAHQVEIPPPVENFRPETPPEVQAVVLRLMAKDPRDRYPVPAEVAADLASLHRPHKPPSTVRAAPTESVEPPGAPGAASRSGTTGPASKTPDTAANLAPTQKLTVLRPFRGWVTAVAFSPDRNLLVAGSVEEGLRLWDFRGARPQEKELPSLHQAEVRALAFSPDSKTLAASFGPLHSKVGLWDLSGEQPQALAVFPGNFQAVEALAFSPDGRRLACGLRDRTVALWSLTGNRPKKTETFRGHKGWVQAVAFSPDGQMVASGAQGGLTRLCHVGRLWFKQRAALAGSRGHLHSVAFAPDGRVIASGGQDRTIRVWDLSAKRPELRSVLRGHKSVVRVIVFPPEGTTLVSVCDEGQVIRWDWSEEQILQEFRVPELMVCSFALTGDGRYLATGSSDGRVVVFRLGTKKKSSSTPG